MENNQPGPEKWKRKPTSIRWVEETLTEKVRRQQTPEHAFGNAGIGQNAGEQTQQSSSAEAGSSHAICPGTSGEAYNLQMPSAQEQRSRERRHQAAEQSSQGSSDGQKEVHRQLPRGKESQTPNHQPNEKDQRPSHSSGNAQHSHTESPKNKSRFSEAQTVPGRRRDSTEEALANLDIAPSPETVIKSQEIPENETIEEDDINADESALMPPLKRCSGHTPKHKMHMSAARYRETLSSHRIPSIAEVVEGNTPLFEQQGEQETLAGTSSPAESNPQKVRLSIYSSHTHGAIQDLGVSDVPEGTHPNEIPDVDMEPYSVDISPSISFNDFYEEELAVMLSQDCILLNPRVEYHIFFCWSKQRGEETPLPKNPNINDGVIAQLGEGYDNVLQALEEIAISRGDDTEWVPHVHLVCENEWKWATREMMDRGWKDYLFIYCCQKPTATKDGQGSASTGNNTRSLPSDSDDPSPPSRGNKGKEKEPQRPTSIRWKKNGQLPPSKQQRMGQSQRRTCSQFSSTKDEPLKSESPYHSPRSCPSLLFPASNGPEPRMTRSKAKELQESVGDELLFYVPIDEIPRSITSTGKATKRTRNDDISAARKRAKTGLGKESGPCGSQVF